jgi:hypothetical protein
MHHHPPSAGESSPHGGALFHGGAPPEHTAEDEAELPQIWQPTAQSPSSATDSSFALLNQIPPMCDAPFCAAPPCKASRAFGLGASFVVGALVVGALAVLGPRKPKMVTSLCNDGDFCHSFCHSNDNAPTLTITGFSASGPVLAFRADGRCQERIVAATITYSLAAQVVWSPTSAAAAAGARLSDNLNHAKSGAFVCMAQWPLHDSFRCCPAPPHAPRCTHPCAHCAHACVYAMRACVYAMRAWLRAHTPAHTHASLNLFTHS